MTASWADWGPDGLPTTGNPSQRADTLTSTQMGQQQKPERLGRRDAARPVSGALLFSLAQVLCGRGV